ncbi:MAG: hypothetical protein ACTS8Z_06190, partial [Candidatus Limnocylindrales bacterium]
LVLVVAACAGSPDPASSADAGSSDPSASPAASAPAEPSGSAAPSSGPVMTDPSLGVEVAIDGLTEPTALAF